MSAAPAGKRCFVIMPIGQEGSAEYEYNVGVFNAIIRPAAEHCGYTVKRADLSFDTGNIPRQIVQDLADADIVVADLSERNANVYFELGIRHVLRRCGTVHIVEENKALPFDVAQYRAIKYSTHFTKIDAAQRAIQEAIRHKEAHLTESDNPVHDALVLPSNYRDTSSSDVHQRLTALQEELATLRAQNDELREKASAVGPAPATLDEDAVEEAIDAAIDRSLQAIANSPARLILQMREAVSGGRHKDLLELMRTVLKSPYLEPRNIAAMASLAAQQDLRSIQNMVLEVGRMRFPTDVTFKRWLAESYIHSADVGLQRRGLAILEDHLGIIWSGRDVGIQKPFVDQAPTSVAVMTDYYHESEQYDRSLALLRAAQQIWPSETRILRNLGRTYRAMGEMQKAEESYRQALEADPDDDLALSWFALLLERQERYPEAFAMLQRAMAADPEDPDYPIALGLFILDHGTPEQLGSGQPLSRADRLSAALPVFEDVLRRTNNDPRVARRIAEALGRFDVAIAQRFLDAGEAREPSIATAREFGAQLRDAADRP